MEISDVRVRVVGDESERLKAVCSVTFDDVFVVRDLKIVEGSHGLFVAMPSRKLSAGCVKCRAQNHLRARFCNECGAKLPPSQIPVDSKGREKAHRDIAHPIAPEFREAVQTRVLEAFQTECENLEEDGERTDDSIDALDDCDDDELDDLGMGGSSRNDCVTEYGVLIADLKGGGRRQRERSERSHQERDSRSGRSDGKSGPDRSDGNRKERKEERAPAVADPDPEAWPRSGQDEEVVCGATGDKGTADEVDEDGFGAGLLDNPPHSSPVATPDEVDEVEVADSADEHDHTPQAESDPDDDGDDAFGAGIL